MTTEETALAQHMRIMQPVLQDDGTTILVIVENEEVAIMMQGLLPRLLPELKKQLRNDSITIRLTIKEAQSEVVTYDKRHQLRHFCELNPALITLGKNLKLELT